MGSAHSRISGSGPQRSRGRQHDTFGSLMWAPRANRGCIVGGLSGFRNFPICAICGVPDHPQRSRSVDIAALTSERTNLSPFTKGCRDRGAPMRILHFFGGLCPNLVRAPILIGRSREWRRRAGTDKGGGGSPTSWGVARLVQSAVALPRCWEPS